MVRSFAAQARGLWDTRSAADDRDRHKNRRLQREDADAGPALADIYDGFLMDAFHEVRMCGVVMLVDKYENAQAAEQREIFKFYLKPEVLARINNWDLVDLSAHKIVGDFVWQHPQEACVLDQLARSDHLWSRRIAIVSTLALIKADSFGQTLQLSELLLRDEHDLMHKAVGWMLREVGKRDVSVLKTFLDKNAPRMPRTALRYAIERLPHKERLAYLAIVKIPEVKAASS